MPNLITVPITVWTDELYMRCPGAVAAGVEQALWGAFREFTKQSGAWLVELWDGEVYIPESPGAGCADTKTWALAQADIYAYYRFAPTKPSGQGLEFDESGQGNNATLRSDGATDTSDGSAETYTDCPERLGYWSDTDEYDGSYFYRVVDPGGYTNPSLTVGGVMRMRQFEQYEDLVSYLAVISDGFYNEARPATGYAIQVEGGHQGVPGEIYFKWEGPGGSGQTFSQALTDAWDFTQDTVAVWQTVELTVNFETGIMTATLNGTVVVYDTADPWPPNAWTDGLNCSISPHASSEGTYDDVKDLHSMYILSGDSTSANDFPGGGDPDIPESGGPKPFNQGKAAGFYDFQARLETARAALGGSYASGDPAVGWQDPYIIDDYAPYDVLYVMSMAYFSEYTYSRDPTLHTRIAAANVRPRNTQNHRSPMASGFNSTSGDTTGQPMEYLTYNERPGAIQLHPTLSGTGFQEGIVPMVALGFPVSYVADSVPVIFERLWYEHILDGALGRLMSQQDKPYTNPVLGQYHGKRFRNGISEARDVARRQANPSDTPWKYPRWA